LSSKHPKSFLTFISNKINMILINKGSLGFSTNLKCIFKYT
jgi:hypothetical protein